MKPSRIFTDDKVKRIFRNTSEFKDVELDSATVSYITKRLNTIAKLEARLNKTLMEQGIIDEPVQIKIGAEIEFYTVAGKDHAVKRLRQLAETLETQPTEEQAIAALGKDDHYMPEASQAKNLNTAFKTTLRNAKHVEVHLEPAYKIAVATERNQPEKKSDATTPEVVTMFQNEIVSPPRNIYAVGQWLNALTQRVIDKAPEYGLKRTQFTTTLHDMSPSSIHFHISVKGKKDGKTFNIMSRDDLPQEKGRKRADPQQVSQIGLHIAHAMNDYLRDNIYMFTPTADAYGRFEEARAMGPKFIGFIERRKFFGMGSAMFRGEGRHTYRKEADYGVPDTGPLRIELRIPDVGCIGHPNKRAYQQQMAAPYDIMEALIYMLQQGVEHWGKEQEKLPRYQQTLTEEELYKTRDPLPKNIEEARERFRAAPSDGLYSKARKALLLERGAQLQRINEKDWHPKSGVSGQHIDRLSTLENDTKKYR